MTVHRLYHSLAFKLGLAFVGISLVGILLFAVIAVRVTIARFAEFRFNNEQAALVAGLEELYAAAGSWDRAALALRRQGSGPNRGGRIDAAFSGLVVTDNEGVVVVPGFGYRRGDAFTADERTVSVPLTVDGERVGSVHVRPAELQANPSAQAFLSGVSRAMIQSAVIAAVLALILGVILAGTLTGPLREITAATRALAAGDLSRRVTVHSADEVGELAASFNQMSADLAAAVNQRRQMTADIAHDLRTPLSIILGYTESLHDGVLPATPDTLAIIHDEARHLNRLVDDLRTLSLADAGELTLMREEVQILELLEHVALAHRQPAQEAQVQLVVEAAADMPRADLDPVRMEQVLRNLVANAIRHTPAGGRVVLAAVRADGALMLTVQDSGSGIAPEHLPHIFDRFYRADAARQNAGDASGLGLAIARTIVQLHKGTITAHSEPGQGARFVITIPAGSALPAGPIGAGAGAGDQKRPSP